jgi:hypothetical protein
MEKNIKLKDIVNETMEAEALKAIKAGYHEAGDQGNGYGCQSDICETAVNPAYCNKTSEICEKYVCTSQIGPSV